MIRDQMPTLTPRTVDQDGAIMVCLLRDTMRRAVHALLAGECHLVGRLLSLARGDSVCIGLGIFGRDAVAVGERFGRADGAIVGAVEADAEAERRCLRLCLRCLEEWFAQKGAGGCGPGALVEAKCLLGGAGEGAQGCGGVHCEVCIVYI